MVLSPGNSNNTKSMIRVLNSPSQLEFLDKNDEKEPLIFTSPSNEILNVSKPRKKKRRWGVRTSRNQSRKKRTNRFSKYDK